MPDEINTITGSEFNSLAGEAELDLVAAFKLSEEEIESILILAEEEGWSTARILAEYDKRIM
jgi:hypothetical protein